MVGIPIELPGENPSAFAALKAALEVDGAGLLQKDLPVTTADSNGPAVALKLFTILKAVVDPEFYGPAGRWNSDDTAPVQRAINTAASEGRILKLRKSYTTDGLVLPFGLWLEGDGSKLKGDVDNKGAGLRLKSSATADAHVSLADKTSDEWTRRGVEIHGLMLSGNRTNQTKPIRGLDIGHDGGNGGGSFIPRHRVDGVEIDSYSGDGAYFGPFTRDSYFDNFTVYKCDGYGVYDAGVDGSRANWNVGQSKLDGVYIVASACRYTNLKSWGSGQFDTASNAVNFRVLKSKGVVLTNLYSQEGAGRGYAFEGQGSDEISGLVATGLISDGDVIGKSASAINVFRVRNSRIEAVVGKFHPTLAGQPNNAMSISYASGNQVTLLGRPTDFTSWVLEAVAGDAITGGQSNDFDVNGHKRRLNALAYASSVTPNPFEGETVTITLTGNININNAGRKPAGFRLRFIFTQDATGGRTVAFGTDFKVGWSPNTAANKVNVIEFLSDGTNWIQIGAMSAA